MRSRVLDATIVVDFRHGKSILEYFSMTPHLHDVIAAGVSQLPFRLRVCFSDGYLWMPVLHNS